VRESNSPSPAVRPAGQKTVQRTVFRAREMDAQVTCQKHKNMTIIRSIFVLFSLPALRIPHFYHACVILSRSGAGEERRRLLFTRAVQGKSIPTEQFYVVIQN